MRDKPTYEDVREALDYSPDTGVFTWKIRPGWRWNRKHGGKRAGYPNDVGIGHRKAYWLIWIKETNWRAHQLAWLWMTGAWPTKGIDHKDNDGLNNAWGNLRLATTQQNAANSPMYSNNSTGFKGVSPHKCGYQARIGLDGKVKALGTFKTPEEANEAYRVAAVKHFGEFARSA